MLSTSYQSDLDKKDFKTDVIDKGTTVAKFDFDSLEKNTTDDDHEFSKSNIVSEQDYVSQTRRVHLSGDKYVSFLVNKTVRNIRSELSEAISYYNQFDLPHLANIKQLLRDAQERLQFHSEARIFHAINKAIFTNQNWDKLEMGQLKLLHDTLRQFEQSEVSNQRIQGFLKQLTQGGIDVLGGYDEKEEK